MEAAIIFNIACMCLSLCFSWVKTFLLNLLWRIHIEFILFFKSPCTIDLPTSPSSISINKKEMEDTIIVVKNVYYIHLTTQNGVCPIHKPYWIHIAIWHPYVNFSKVDKLIWLSHLIGEPWDVTYWTVLLGSKII